MTESKVDMTQVEALHVALQQSFSPDSSVRDPAEASIKHLKFVPGATQMLLHITEEKQVRFDAMLCCIELFPLWGSFWHEYLSNSSHDNMSHFLHMNLLTHYHRPTRPTNLIQTGPI